MLLITQNVDDLHQRAGSASLLPMHGQLRMLRCERSGRNEERMSEADLDPLARGMHVLRHPFSYEARHRVVW